MLTSVNATAKPLNAAKFTNNSENEFPLSKIPRIASTKYVNGNRYDKGLMQNGIASNGKMKPDSRMEGKRKKIAKNTACC